MQTIAERIKSRRLELGISVDDVADALGVNRTTVYRYESKDIEKMPITVVEPLAKVLRVTPEYIMGWDEELTDYARYGLKPVTRKTIPVLGNVHCGTPQYAEQEYMDAVSSEIKADFALRAIGDSMIGEGIEDGDFIFVRKQESVQNGEIAVVLIDNEATIKRIHKTGNTLLLNAANPNYEPLIFNENSTENIQILGKVVAYTHYLEKEKHNAE